VEENNNNNDDHKAKENHPKSPKSGDEVLVPYVYQGKIRPLKATIIYLDEESKMATVFFHTPLENGMKPCRQFLNGNCNFEKCKFSHGYEVSIDQVKSIESQYKNIQKGSHCLVKYSDGLWYPSIVTFCDDEKKVYTVSFRDYDETVVVDEESIEPLQEDASIFSESEGDDEEDDFESEESETDLQNEMDLELEETATFIRLSNNDSFVQDNYRFGEWERHTKGIGSKLLLRMGFKFVLFIILILFFFFFFLF